MGNILVIIFVVGFEVLARINPNFEAVAKFRNYDYVEPLYEFIERQTGRVKLNFPYMVPAVIAILISLIALLGYMLFGKFFSLIAMLYVSRELPPQTSENTFVEFNERYFANLLYFALFGSFAGLLYNFFAIARVKHPELSKIHGILAWVPARIAAFSFALVGSFSPVLKVWLAQAANIQVPSSKILTDCGLAGAKGADVNEKQLSERALIAWAVFCIIILIRVV